VHVAAEHSTLVAVQHSWAVAPHNRRREGVQPAPQTHIGDTGSNLPAKGRNLRILAARDQG
jgi:hypothetical protein